MKYSKEVIVLKEKWNPGAQEVPTARALEMVQVSQDDYHEVPFPLSLGAQKRLLELNDNLNDILDVVEDADMEMVDEVKSKYSELRSWVDNELDGEETDFDDEDARQLMNQIVGES